METMQLNQSATKKECNTKKVQHENGDKSEIWRKKSPQIQCTRVHKWITGCPLTDRYTLVYTATWQFKVPQ